MSINPTTVNGTPVAGVSQSVEILQGLIEANRESVIVVDPAKRVIAANQSANRAFGRPLGSLMRRRLSEVFRDLQLDDAFSGALVTGQRSEVKMVMIGTGRRSYDVNIVPIDLDGATHAVGVFNDVTRLERLERVRQEFLSNISHELRTPLTSIMAFVETLEEGAIDDRENNRRFLGIIRRNAARMHELIADILELSMIESGNVSIETKQVKITNLVSEVFASLSSKAAEREVSLINEVPAEAKACADPIRLEQMLTNLIDNAIKFNRQGGSVTVSAVESDQKASILVSDTGEGILPDHLPRVFERFYRSDRGRTREVGGTGLGLAIVKHLARLHGGGVSVTSRPGEGTTFTIELPV